MFHHEILIVRRTEIVRRFKGKADMVDTPTGPKDFLSRASSDLIPECIFGLPVTTKVGVTVADILRPMPSQAKITVDPSRGTEDGSGNRCSSVPIGPSCARMTVFFYYITIRYTSTIWRMRKAK